MKLFPIKLKKLDMNAAKKQKILEWYLNDAIELRWALRVALDRYNMGDVNKAEKILAKYEKLNELDIW
jgi:hypothetical protein